MTTPIIHNVMKNQAGTRLIIACKIKDRGIFTSHYSNIEEALNEHKSYGRIIEWYSINSGERILI